VEKAEQQLDALRKSDSQTIAEKLQAAYQRLWDFNAIEGLERARIRLFQLALCSFESLNPDKLWQALRFWGDIGDSELDLEDFRRVYSNFLIHETTAFPPSSKSGLSMRPHEHSS
jgi:hypothetical protein